MDILRPKGGFDLFGGEEAMSAFNESAHHAGKDCGRAALVEVWMSGGFDDDFVAGLGVGADGDLVGHSAGRHIDGCGLTQDFSSAPFESDDGGVVAEYVVTEGGSGDGLFHGFGGPGNGVASEVYHLKLPSRCERKQIFADFLGPGEDTEAPIL